MLTFTPPCLQEAERVQFGQLQIKSHPRTRKNCVRIDVNAAGMLRRHKGVATYAWGEEQLRKTRLPEVELQKAW